MLIILYCGLCSNVQRYLYIVFVSLLILLISLNCSLSFVAFFFFLLCIVGVHGDQQLPLPQCHRDRSLATFTGPVISGLRNALAQHLFKRLLKNVICCISNINVFSLPFYVKPPCVYSYSSGR